MMYLSQLLKKPVKDSSERMIGRLQDILIQPIVGAYAPLLFLLVVDKRKKQERYIPYDYVAAGGREIVLKNLLKHIPQSAPGPDFIFLSRDILDEQIVDMEGARVVRVNDLTLGSFENELCVLGIDVSFKGLLRRLGLSELDLLRIFKVKLIDWRKTQLVKGALKVNAMLKDLARLHPADLANIIEDLATKQASSLVDSLDSAAAAQVVEEMDPATQTTIIKYLGPEKAADIVQNMSVDETVDLLRMLPKNEAKKFLAYLQKSKSKKIQRLITYPDDTAGGLMTTDYVDAGEEWTVAQVIEKIKRLSPDFRTILYVYVIADDGTLAGVVSVRTLLVSEPADVLKSIMKPLSDQSLLFAHQKVGAVINTMTKYNLYNAAVLDDQRKLVGVVTIDDVMRHLAPYA